MAIQSWSDDVLIVTLPREPRLCRELAGLNDVLSTHGARHVIVDFSHVDILSSAGISNLLILSKLITDAGWRLIFTNVAVTTRCIFRIAGLLGAFELAADRAAALEALNAVRT
ncbi:MAG TPA: anti-sigma factor antagonist [Phycisphaerales bacterium]|nr:anti-sigma factor antagonist [Phycisphaerales bacterium]